MTRVSTTGALDVRLNFGRLTCVSPARSATRIILLMQGQTLDPSAPPQHPVEELRILPRSRGARVAVWLLIAALGGLTFSAWLQPNMVFDLANMVFCN